MCDFGEEKRSIYSTNLILYFVQYVQRALDLALRFYGVLRTDVNGHACSATGGEIYVTFCIEPSKWLVAMQWLHRRLRSIKACMRSE